MKFAIICLFLLSTQVANAQSPEIMARHRALRAKVLRQDVGLSEARATKVEAIITGFEPARGKARKHIMQARRRMVTMVRNDAPEADLAKAVAAFRSANQAIRRLRETQFADLQAVLSAKEQALLLLSMGRLNRRAEQLMHEFHNK